MDATYLPLNPSGLNKDFRKMITEHADLEALTVKDIHTASDGTRKVVFSDAVML